jgi:hypothetical protein
MASIVSNILTGGALQGISKVIDSIRGKSPEDAAKLQEATLTIQAAREKYAADFEMAELLAATQANQMQADVNKVEAANGSTFVAGWRPFIGWICGCALAFQFIIRPLLTWIVALLNHPAVVPALDMGDLITVLLGMLGLGAMRSYDKKNGTSVGH